jgi:hypothetical protein
MPVGIIRTRVKKEEPTMAKTTWLTENGYRRLTSRSAAGPLTALLVLVLMVVGLAASAGVAEAASTSPPIGVFPTAGDVAPSASAVSDPYAPEATCSGWYRQSSYVGQPTGSSWWEYQCHHVWPPNGTGATNANWWGQEIYDDYFYWDGSAPVFYGQWNYDGYSDGWYVGSDCSYWWDGPSGQSYGPLDESFQPIDC